MNRKSKEEKCKARATERMLELWCQFEKRWLEDLL